MFFFKFADSTSNKVIYHDAAKGYSLKKDSVPQSLNNGDVVIFQVEQYNDGNSAFNRYVCPTTGIYYLSATLDQWDTDPFYLGVKQETLNVLSYKEGNNNFWNSHTNSRLIRCEKNDTIVVVATAECRVDQTHITAMLMQEEGIMIILL